ncbi:MAG: MoxR family ATPase [Planctomycetes bacterium]|nr:MoxR family ATPase [Planctomycetota bacterium]
MSEAPQPPQLVDVADRLHAIATEVERVIVGQSSLLRGLLIGLVADGHILLEGMPGLAKSLAVDSFARAVGGVCHRIQFTPDLLPSDLIGTQVYQPKTGDWTVHKGPVFGNFVLADEINRAPAKVQSALLEAMQERQVSLAGETCALPDPFLVLATQNPVEQEGTYPLPEAQLDRFMLKVVVDYPNREEERAIIKRMRRNGRPVVRQVATTEDIYAARTVLDEVFVDEKIEHYVVDLVFATRDPAASGLPGLVDHIDYGASPRASIALTRAATANALLEGRGYVTPSDVKAVAHDVLRHRVVPSFEAEAEGRTAEQIVQGILDVVEIP